jgi:primosomal protein N' (replication factor Y)
MVLTISCILHSFDIRSVAARHLRPASNWHFFKQNIHHITKVGSAEVLAMASSNLPIMLVSILDADGGLFSGDFRASERMAQLIVQVAGRAGRAEEPGRVIIQTHLADHPLLIQLTEQGYFAFAEQALSERRAAGLPPFAHLALLRAEAHKPGQAEGFLDEACSEAERLLGELNLHGIELLGPVPAPMERRAGRYRAQLLLQANARAPLHRLLSHWLLILEQMPSGRQVRWSLDVDPVDLY